MPIIPRPCAQDRTAPVWREGLLPPPGVEARETAQQTLGSYLQMVVPGHSDQILVQVGALLAHREVVSAVVVAVLLFFSAVAFGILQRAMAVIFHHRPRKGR